MTHPIPNPSSGQSLTPTSEERTWAVLGHLAALVAAVISVGWLSFVGPLVIWAIYKDRSAFVRQAAAGSFNFNLAVWVAIIAGWVMFFTVILIPVAIIVWIVAVLAGIWYHVRAAMAANRGESFRYPWSIPVLH
ncbi:MULTISPECIES: DUF4870 domain-containing protein [Terrabacter]|jgi:uncharacterized Tic20 family protein|uniref:Membrane protein n=1 Tax=Terrabacter tumescens TaxID=60443 RepID=A0ABQ2HTU7_9MICO|nr:DUF4870 domain-containing protein [Terrabacter tumescens]WVM96284.1 DUF4870 domain-containing protein [Terrabacter sp. C0L_2]GGM91421.1 membrane protein [Terrabacter tumescens]